MCPSLIFLRVFDKVYLIKFPFALSTQRSQIEEVFKRRIRRVLQDPLRLEGFLISFLIMLLP